MKTAESIAYIIIWDGFPSSRFQDIFSVKIQLKYFIKVIHLASYCPSEENKSKALSTGIKLSNAGAGTLF